MGNHIVLSIIIVNWNVKDLLTNCLASIKEQMQLPPEDYEVIVVDNASADGSVEMVKRLFPEVILIANPANFGFGAGCNQGFELRRGEFVFLLNPDTVVVDHAVDKLLDTIRKYPRAGIVGGCLLNTDGSFQRVSGGSFPSLWRIAWNYLLLHRLLPKGIGPSGLFFQDNPQGVTDVDWVSGAAMLLRKNAIGTSIFDESYFMYGEDLDLCDRMHQKGWQVLFSSEAKIVHHQRSSYKKQSSMDLLRAIHNGPRQFFARKSPKWTLIVYDFILLIGYFIRWILYSLISIVKPGQGFEDLASFSRQFLLIIVQSFFDRSNRVI